MTAFLAIFIDELQQLGPFEIIYGGDEATGIPAVCWKIKPGPDPGYSLYDLADRLRARGWQIPAYARPAQLEKQVVQRILVRHAVSRVLGSLLVDDIRAALAYFDKHPIQVSMDVSEAAGFHH